MADPGSKPKAHSEARLFPQQLRTVDQKRPKGNQERQAGGDKKWRLKTLSGNPRPPDLNFTSNGSAFGPFGSHFHLTLRTTKPPDVTYRSHGGAGAGLGKKHPQRAGGRGFCMVQ